ncbi:rab-GTPase-TBC domain-containing protein [Macrophomina phaseolina]|uniref:Rab-GTPase-TBC domain-containing protein n=1 Tax=Macrophomina phaseolina TaxID=35725 RepID=A0ABQ8GX25_9PEZI|nr:rab-GTPase-TBC domain-containing protein [Macrophomina phaseolina]
MNNGPGQPESTTTARAAPFFHLPRRPSITPPQRPQASIPQQASPTSPTASPTSPRRPSSSRSSWFHPSARRPRTSPGPRPSPFKRSSKAFPDELKRDSGFAPSTARPSQDGDPRVPRVPSLPTIVVHDEPPRPSTANNVSDLETISRCRSIETDIPEADFDDLAEANIAFSKRGTLLLNGKRMNEMIRSTTEQEDARQKEDDGKDNSEGARDDRGEQRTEGPTGEQRDTQDARPASRSRSLAPRRNYPGTRVLSADETMLSKKVRCMYEYGDEKAADWVVEPSIRVDGSIEEENPTDAPLDEDSLQITKSRQHGDTLRSASIVSRATSMISKEPHELAGGIEDWEDIDGYEVDRYGFILPKKVESTDQRESMVTFETPKLQRVATQLQLASEAPRRKRTMRRTGSIARSSRTNFSSQPKRLSSSRSLRPPESVYTTRSITSVRSNILRNAANRLPHNRSRRLVDEASDMLTLPPGLAAIAEEKDGGRSVEMMKRKEWQREEKWRKMGKLVGQAPTGGGMLFEFDTKSPKLIERTWKGIPDRWRASAWYAFLSASAKKDPDSPPDEELVEAFYDLQEEDSAEDMQIDMDVPRTISHHIMFRRRYRGGQRLLFRVLHAFSLYLPDTGYVQGMAALAATLLCYYDEERAFVMLVRLWKLRGLERLYQSGFEGLMEALTDFEKYWLAGGEVAQKLEELGVHCTAYGTRWYLTLFNYSIPFPAQLRVWDVFMLLGDAATSCEPNNSFGADLDVLHATSAALIDATREILLDSDFENAMKTLTSWIPVKDEDLLMRVARAEWKQRKKRGRANPAATG